VKLNGVKQEDPNGEIQPQEGDIVQVGKRKFAKLTLA
jgi:tyrosyl-tRNA synthetase